MKILSFGGTDTGKKRTNNEDAFLLNDEFCLYAVADGVGGNEGGEVASRIAVETLAETIPALLGEQDRTPPSPSGLAHADSSAAALEYAVVLSNKQIREAQNRNVELYGMGTTLTALLVGKGRAVIAHAGDSRAYLYRAGSLMQLTNDHSIIAEQVLAGLITPEQARMSPYRHVITRALGMEDSLIADIAVETVEGGDVFLLCTDGLTEMVEDKKIGAILEGSTPGDAVRLLLASANEQGGVDNITAVVVKIVEI